MYISKIGRVIYSAISSKTPFILLICSTSLQLLRLWA